MREVRPLGVKLCRQQNQSGRFLRSFLKYIPLTVPTGLMPVGTVAKDRVCITLMATVAKRIRQPSATEGWRDVLAQLAGIKGTGF